MRFSVAFLLTENCGSVGKGSKKGLDVAAGNAFIFKEDKEKDVIFRTHKGGEMKQSIVNGQHSI